MSYQPEEEEEETVPQQVADLANASVPQSIRGIRACKRCGILKTLEQFVNEGCENCPVLDMVRLNWDGTCVFQELQRPQTRDLSQNPIFPYCTLSFTG